MPTLAEHLGYDRGQLPQATGNDTLPAGFIGIEVELEAGENEGAWPQAAGWELKPDGSLRDGMEYVFDGPQSGDAALASIRSLAQAMEAYAPDPTFRCSTHIHLDVRDLTWFQYQKLVLLYMVYEDVMFDHAEPYRRTSNFCIPFMSNDWLGSRFGQQVVRATSDRHRFSHLSQWPKYSALNLQTSSTFGTVEFRGSHALTSEEDLVGLAQRMLHLKRFVLEDGSENLEVFLGVAAVGPDAIFLQGLRPGYAMTEGALDMGLSSAWATLIEPVAQALPDIQVPPPDPLSIHRDVMQRAIVYDATALANLNVELPTGRHTYAQALTILSALNSLNGVNVTFSQLVATRRNTGVLRFIRAESALMSRHWGININPETIV